MHKKEREYNNFVVKSVRSHGEAYTITTESLFSSRNIDAGLSAIHQIPSENDESSCLAKRLHALHNDSMTQTRRRATSGKLFQNGGYLCVGWRMMRMVTLSMHRLSFGKFFVLVEKTFKMADDLLGVATKFVFKKK